MQMTLKSGLRVMAGLAVAFCVTQPFPAAGAAMASGRLSIYGAVEASYSVEARTGQYTAMGQGVAEGGSLQTAVLAGPATVRVRKANSRSAAYTLVIRGGESDIQIRNLPYDATVTIDIPEARPGMTLVLSVFPE